MDTSLILSLITGSLIITDEIITEYFIKKDLGEEWNPLMKNKKVRIASVPFALGAIGIMYWFKKRYPEITPVLNSFHIFAITLLSALITINVAGIKIQNKK